MSAEADAAAFSTMAALIEMPRHTWFALASAIIVGTAARARSMFAEHRPITVRTAGAGFPNTSSKAVPETGCSRLAEPAALNSVKMAPDAWIGATAAPSPATAIETMAGTGSKKSLHRAVPTICAVGMSHRRGALTLAQMRAIVKTPKR